MGRDVGSLQILVPCQCLLLFKIASPCEPHTFSHEGACHGSTQRVAGSHSWSLRRVFDVEAQCLAAFRSFAFRGFPAHVAKPIPAQGKGDGGRRVKSKPRKSNPCGRPSSCGPTSWKTCKRTPSAAMAWIPRLYLQIMLDVCWRQRFNHHARRCAGSPVLLLAASLFAVSYTTSLHCRDGPSPYPLHALQRLWLTRATRSWQGPESSSSVPAVRSGSPSCMRA